MPKNRGQDGIIVLNFEYMSRLNWKEPPDGLDRTNGL